MKRVLALALVMASVTSAAMSVAAPGAGHEPTPEEVERARTFYNAATSAYSAARYADAARSFEQAYLLAPRPQLLFSLAQAERKEFFTSGDAAIGRRAVHHYKEYIDQVTTGGRRSEAIDAKADLEARLARLDPGQTTSVQPEKRRARVTVYSPTPGARVSLDGGAPQEVPFFSDLEAGKHRIRVSADGFFDEEREVSGDNAVDQPVDLTLRERPAMVTVALDAKADVYVDGRIVATTPLARPIEVSSGPHVIAIAANGKRAFTQDVVLTRASAVRLEPRLETSGQRVASITMIGVGAASLIGGAIFGIGALNAEGSAEDVQSQRSRGNISASDLDTHNAAIDRRDDFRTISVVGMSAGAALVIGGGLLYIFDKPSISVVPPRHEPTPPPRPKEPGLELGAYPFIGPGLAGAGFGGRF